MSDSLRIKCILKNEQYGFFEAPFGLMFKVEDIKEFIAEADDGNKYGFISSNEQQELISEVNRLKFLLTRCKRYMEEQEIIFDGEFGGARDLTELISDGDMPGLYDEICEVVREGVK